MNIDPDSFGPPSDAKKQEEYNISASAIASSLLNSLTRQLANSRFLLLPSFGIMKLHALTALLFLAAAAALSSSRTGTRAQLQDEQQYQYQQRGHRDMDMLVVARAAKGHGGPVVVAAAPAPSGSNQVSSSQPASAAPSTTASGAGASTTSVTSAAGSASGSGTGMTGSGSSQSTPVPTGTNGVPPLSLISSGMPPGTPSPVAATYAPGATPPIPGAPVLPAKCTFHPCCLVSSSCLFVRSPLMSFGFQSCLKALIGRHRTKSPTPVSHLFWV